MGAIPRDMFVRVGDQSSVIEALKRFVGGWGKERRILAAVPDVQGVLKRLRGKALLVPGAASLGRLGEISNSFCLIVHLPSGYGVYLFILL